MMDFRVLVENSKGSDERLQAEHGLSFYFETDGLKWLLDVGETDLFARNAHFMGIDISAVDHLLLSHAHADHTGGLATFLKLNDHAQIWLSSHIDGRHFYSTRRGFKRDISIDYRLLETYPDRFHFISDNQRITDSVAILADIPCVAARPLANDTLLAGEELDDFSHEMAVMVKGNAGVEVFSSCSHKGILNTLYGAEALLHQGIFAPAGMDGADARAILAYVGGLHLVQSDEQHQFETPAQIRELAGWLKRDFPALQVFTGHCTGADALVVLKEELGDRFHHFYTGFDSSSNG